MRRRRSQSRRPPVVEDETRLVLVGGGHTHAHVLRMLAARPLKRTRVTVISPWGRSVYSGMVPATLAGRYSEDEGALDIAALAARAEIGFVRDRVESIDTARNEVRTSGGGIHPWDVLSLDVGARPRDAARAAAFPHVVPVKPVETAAPRIAAWLDRAGETAAAHVAVVGAGAGGVELAFALRAQLGESRSAHVTLLEREGEVLPGLPASGREKTQQLLESAGVKLMLGATAVEPEPGGLQIDGVHHDFGLVLWCTGAEGLPLLAASNLPCDSGGFVWVDDHLRVEGHPRIFAVGDCSRMRSRPELPRAGVYAVRQGPILLDNLRRCVGKARRLRRYRPQRRALQLISTADRRAIMLYGDRARHGRPWWWLKDRIDRRFVGKYDPPALRRTPAKPMEPEEMEPCGGCAAKVDAETLSQGLCELAPVSSDAVRVGLDQPDDAAVVAHGTGPDLVTTIDGFPPFSDDLHLVGRVAAINAASDIWAMGATPTSALALVGLPAGDRRDRAGDLATILSGIRAGLDEMGVALVGGHTIASAERLVALGVSGPAGPTLMTKGGARPGDVLLLTKPLGTGVLLAAGRMGDCPERWTEGALASMVQSNGPAARVLAEAGVASCTDVSGFGLIGHLREMLEASGVGADVRLGGDAALVGARELLGAGWRSSAHRANAQALSGLALGEDEAGSTEIGLWCDPQTSGGLLAAVPAARVDAIEAALLAARVTPLRIGVVSVERGLRLGGPASAGGATS